jgi:hypothetical protein
MGMVVGVLVVGRLGVFKLIRIGLRNGKRYGVIIRLRMMMRLLVNK